MLRRVVFAFLYIVLATPVLVLATPVLADPIRVTIDLSDQRMYVSVDGSAQFNWSVSTGRAGYRTPTGTFRPLRMYAEYYSVKYDNAPMPWSVFFFGGYAIHGTTEINALGMPASHGCVRLHPENAKRLFYLIKANGMKSTSIRVRK